jgi:hypothetical protein
MDQLIRIDRQIYVAALKRFFLQAKAAEAELGHRFISDHALASAQPKLSYLGVDLQELYRGRSS